MNQRERFWRWANFEEVDRLPFWADWLGPWKAWQEQGLPVEPDMVGPGLALDDNQLKAWSLEYFGFEGMYSAFWGQPRVPVEIGVYPPFAAPNWSACL